MATQENNDVTSRLVQDIEEASRIPAKRRSTNVKNTVSRLASAAYSDGLLPDELTRLIEVVTKPAHLDQATVSALIRELYPAAGISADNVLSVVGCLGHGSLKAPLNIQSLLLRWLILVYHILEAPNVLSQAYAVLFNLLDTAVLRAQLCHLLALITRRKHVQPFRIQSL
jgi:centromere protein I